MKGNLADAGNFAKSNISETINNTKKFYLEFKIFHNIFKNLHFIFTIISIY